MNEMEKLSNVNAASHARLDLADRISSRQRDSRELMQSVFVSLQTQYPAA